MKPTISEAQARAIVKARRDQLRGSLPLPWARFIAGLHSAGILAEPVSVHTIRKIVEGKYYPHLTDFDGNPYVWEKLPVAGRSGERAGLAKRLDLLEARFARFEKLEAALNRLNYRFKDVEDRLDRIWTFGSEVPEDRQM